MSADRTAERVPETAEPAGWVRDRPHMPGYGVPEDNGELLDWSEIAARLAAAKIYWVCSATSDGVPHAVPVWGAFVDRMLYFGAGPRTSRNLARNPRLTIHLESGDEVVIAEGRASVVHDPGEALVQAIDDQCAAKYDWRPSTEGDGRVAEGWWQITPTKVLAWTAFPANATRWTRSGEEDSA